MANTKTENRPQAGKTVPREKMNSRSGFDYTLLFVVFFLLAFGLVMVYSTSSYNASLEGDGFFYLRKQAISVGVGLVVMFAASFFPYYKLEKYSIIILLFSILLITLVKTPIGVKVKGATRWIKIAGFTIQPSEFAKIAVIIFTAATVAKLGRKAIKTFKASIVTLIAPGVICVLVLILTRNLSSAIIIAGIAFTIYALAAKGAVWPWVYLGVVISGGVLYVLAVIKGWFGGYLSFRGERVLAWLNLEKYSDGAGFQTLQSLYSIGSGGMFGKGFGKSIQKLGFLPEAQNDMIFSIICEELGFFGGAMIIFAFGILLWRIFDISQYCTDMFGVLLVTGVFSHIALQVIVNIAVVTNLFPNTGLTLPFISYGGSSIIFLLAEIGIVMNVSRYRDFRTAKAPEGEGEKGPAKKDERRA